jgi:hypothetical protein
VSTEKGTIYRKDWSNSFDVFPLNLPTLARVISKENPQEGV